MKKWVWSAVFIIAVIAPVFAEDKVIAVVQFKNASFNKGLDYLTVSIPEILTTHLSAIKGITVVERDQLQKVIGEKKLSLAGFGDSGEYQMIGQELSANSILMGSFTTLGQYVRIDARLIDIAEVKVIATYQVTAEIGKDLENKIGALAQKIKFSLTGEPYAMINIYSIDDASIILDGQLIGVSPLDDRFVTVGEHHLLIGKKGYADFNTLFTLTNSQIANMNYGLMKLPRAFQFDIGISGMLPRLFPDKNIQSTPLVNIIAEAHIGQVSIAAMCRIIRYKLIPTVYLPGGYLDTYEDDSLIVDYSVALRYYPWSGTFTPYIGAGVSLTDIYLDWMEKYIDTQGFQEVLAFTPFLELGTKINVWDDHFSIFFGARVEVPATIPIYEKDQSIFGDVSYIETYRHSEWVTFEIGVSYNFF
ncbi:MAG: hypothetical protein A2Y33_16760 [Spirochaetes bacterium GWF1_51_8]|nr:MAG: hypothetical protein A2Y33_16760 [Spirochaetes bacterium GWF1_51_8]